MALRMAAGVRMSVGAGAWIEASSAARRPVDSAMRRRSAETAGAVADIGRLRPRASTRRAMVLAVPMLLQVPMVGQSRPEMSSVSATSICPARCCAQKRRQSVQAPMVLPL